MKHINAVIFFTLFSMNIHADDAEVNLSNKTASFRYSGEGLMGNESAFYNLGFVYTESNDKIADLGLFIKGQAIDFPSTVHVGLRAYSGEIDNKYSLTAIALGGGLHLEPEIWEGFGIGAEGYYAPGVTSFDKTKGLFEYKYFVSFSFTNSAQFSIGNKVMSADFKEINSIKFINSTYTGLSIIF